MSTYEGVEQELFVEAMRITPAIAATKINDASDDALLLYEVYLEEADHLGVTREQAWSILAAAGAVWVTQLLHHQAAIAGTCVHVQLEQAVAVAQNWVTLHGA